MTTNLKPYERYKTVRESLIDRIPVHWDAKRAKHSFREVDDRSSDGMEEMLSVSHKTGVTPRSEKNVTMFMAESNVGHKLCQPDDIVVNTMWAWMAALGVSRQVGIVSPSYGVYRPRSTGEFVPRYLDYLLRTEVYRAEYVRGSRGITTSRLRLYPDKFLNIPLIEPPIEEQRLIVRFLDNHSLLTARLLRVKQKLIALLNEQRQAVIGQVITRGLDPKTRMKPSGVAMLGDVPEHWEVIPFKRRVGFQEGPGIMAADFRDKGVPLLRISCLRGETASLDGCNFLDPEMVRRRWSHFAIRPGDYLLSASASTGGVVRATEIVANAIPYTGILRLWPLTGNVFMPFVQLYMGCRPFQEQIDSAKAGVAIEHFGPTHLKRMFITLPPLSEQKSIVSVATERTSSLSEAIASALRETAFVREFRNRLISDVVTGKLDVREAAARLPEQAPDVEPLDEIEDLPQDESAADEKLEAAE